MTAFIVASRRTAIVPRGGVFAAMAVHELGAAAVRACLADAGIEPGEIDELIAGNSLGAGGNPARLIALASGLSERVAGMTVDRQCAGGLDAILTASALIAAGQAEIVLAGGAESFSRRPQRFATDPSGGAATQYEQAPFTPWPDRDPNMAEAANALGQDLGISRNDQDAWASESHAKANAAQHRVSEEICDVAGSNLLADPFTRSLSLAIARRAPQIVGTITSANAAVAADGAAFCLVVSERVASRLGLPAVRIHGGATLGGNPERPGLAPIAPIKATLVRANVTPNQLSVAEVMEAYAVQAIACVSGAGVDPLIVNPGGGALARGHPIGASGGVLAVRLTRELLATGGSGIAAIAAGGGIGTAVLLTRV